MQMPLPREEASPALRNGPARYRPIAIGALASCSPCHRWALLHLL